MSPSIARREMAHFRKPISINEATDLSPREKEILNELAQGNSAKIVAQKLILSDHTVRSHIKNIYTKLNVNSTTGANNKIYLK